MLWILRAVIAAAIAYGHMWLIFNVDLEPSGGYSKSDFYVTSRHALSFMAVSAAAQLAILITAPRHLVLLLGAPAFFLCSVPAVIITLVCFLTWIVPVYALMELSLGTMWLGVLLIGGAAYTYFSVAIFLGSFEKSEGGDWIDGVNLFY